MALANSGCVLQGISIEINEKLSPVEVIELLDGLRDLRLGKWVNITGLPADVEKYIQELKGAMVNPERIASANGGKELLWSRKNAISICVDLWRYIRTCKEVISRWPDSHDTDRKYMFAKLDDLFILPPGLDESGNLLHQFPAETDPDEESRRAILRLEAFNKRIWRLRYRRYPHNSRFKKEKRPDILDEARDRLYKRRTFYEIKLARTLTTDKLLSSPLTDEESFYHPREDPSILYDDRGHCAPAD